MYFGSRITDNNTFFPRHNTSEETTVGAARSYEVAFIF